MHIGFSRDRSGGLVFPSLSEFSTVYCDPHSQKSLGTTKMKVLGWGARFCAYAPPHPQLRNSVWKWGAARYKHSLTLLLSRKPPRAFCWSPNSQWSSAFQTSARTPNPAPSPWYLVSSYLCILGVWWLGWNGDSEHSKPPGATELSGSVKKPSDYIGATQIKVVPDIFEWKVIFTPGGF